LTVAQTNLDYTTIHAPIDGTVIARNVDVGQTVAASLQAPTLFTIAQDLTKMQVYASTDESDVGMIKNGQVVTFKVDAFPRDTFTGRVSQIRMNATTVQNVVTYNTVIDFNNPELKLFPGMTAYITIPAASATSVLRVPNGALRYKPDLKAEELRALLQKYGFDDSKTAAAADAKPEAPAARGKPSETQVGDAGPTRNPRLDVALLWKLHTSLHKGLVQLWRYTQGHTRFDRARATQPVKPARPVPPVPPACSPRPAPPLPPVHPLFRTPSSAFRVQMPLNSPLQNPVSIPHYLTWQPVKRRIASIPNSTRPRMPFFRLTAASDSRSMTSRSRRVIRKFSHAKPSSIPTLAVACSCTFPSFRRTWIR